MVTFKEADGEKMRALQAELVTVLLRANEQKMEAAVAVFALMRCARPLLDRYPDHTRLALLEVIEAFLHHEHVDSPIALVN